MSELSLEIVFAVLESTEVNNLLRFSFVCVEYRDVCKSKTLWKRIFNKHGLVMLKKSKSLSSWLVNFHNALIGMRIVDKFTKERPVFSMKPVHLKAIKDVSMIHIPGVTNKDELQKYIFLSSFVGKVEYNNTNILEDIQTKRNIYDASYVKLEIKREADVYLMCIFEKNLWSNTCTEHAKYKLNREQVNFLLYRLTCNSLLKTA